MQDNDDYNLLDEWLENNEIPDKDNKNKSKKEKNGYNPFSELKKEDFIDYKQTRKFLKGDEDLFYEWLERNEIIDKDKDEADDSFRLQPLETLNPKKLNARLDLHGYSVQESIKKLQKFIEESFRKNEKIIIVIHGKGIHSRQGPIIKKAITHWLNTVGKSYIRHFRRAPSKLGGTGATIIWLK